MPALSFQSGSLYTSAGQRKYLNADERRRFVAAANATPRPDLRTLCLTLAYSGCRISEALALRVGHVSIEGGFVAVRSLKKRKETIVVREIPLPVHLLAMLDETFGIENLDPEQKLWPLSRSRAWRLIKGVMHAAGIPSGPHATPKGLRHGFGVHAISSGVPINLVQRWLGHARLETTTIYLQAMGAEERHIAQRMWAD